MCKGLEYEEYGMFVELKKVNGVGIFRIGRKGIKLC